MTVKKILQYGDKMLKTPCEEVKNIDKEVLKLVKDLKDTLNNSNGIGLAAPQIGILKRVILIDLKDKKEPIVLINPKVIEKHGKEVSVEGCLSYVGFEGELIRPKKIKVVGKNLHNEKVEFQAEGILAKVFCHEIDHLEGIMYIDKAKKIYKLEEQKK